MKKEALLFFSSLGMAASLIMGIGELALRIRYGEGSLPREIGGGLPRHLVIADERTGYTLTPGFRGKALVPGKSDVELRINRQGLRDHERQIPPSAETVVILGDSFAFGHGVPFEEIWPALLENKIRAEAPRVYVLKAGVPGFAWSQYYQQYIRLLPGLNRHSLVIVAFTVDAAERMRDGYVAKGGILVQQHYPNLVVWDGLVYEKASRCDWINRIDAFLRKRSYFFRWFNQRIVFVYHNLKRAVRERLEDRVRKGVSPEEERPSPPPPIPVSQQRHIRHALKILDSISELAKTKGAKTLVLLVNDPNAWADHVAFYKLVLSEKGIPVLDLAPYEEVSSRSWRIPNDGHWNEFGNQEVARLTYDFIREKRLLESIN